MRRSLLGRDSAFLIGVDLKKSLDILLPAYDDDDGVTASFSLNLLARINRELDGDFDIGSFAHRAVYNEAKGRIEIYLESLTEQTVQVLRPPLQFRQGRTHSHRELAQIFGARVPGAGVKLRLAPGRGLDRRRPALQPASAALRLGDNPSPPPSCAAPAVEAWCRLKNPRRGSVSDLPTGNAVIGQSGGPTAVINQALVGVIEGLREGLVDAGKVKRIFGMRHGVRGISSGKADELIDLTPLSAERLERIARTPSAALGSTRDKPDAAYCDRILEGCRSNDIRYFFYIGGNDSADTCRIVAEKAAEAGYELRCFHVPKTIDNDLRENDHTPGFPSAARFVTLAHMGDALDNASLGGIKINIIMGRNAGFLTASAALARELRETDADPAKRPAPHLIYVPEVPFVMDEFLADVDAVYTKLGRCQIAVSEGIRDADGKEIGPQLMGTGEVDAHGNVQLSGSGALGDGLAGFLKKGLTPAGRQGAARPRRYVRLSPALLAGDLRRSMRPRRGASAASPRSSRPTARRAPR